MKLALQGTTTVMSSGDDGVGGTTCYGASGKIFEVEFASSCPYVLSVGSTEWDRFDPATPPTPGRKLHEVATKRFPSGGGFSNVFGIPSYQRRAVSGYFDQVESQLGFDGYHHFVRNGDFSGVKGGVYHRGGRAYPDVGAVGDRQVVYSNGSWWLVGGTSLSSPVWGAVLNLVNEERIAAGKGTVGFIHPVLVRLYLSCTGSTDNQVFSLLARHGENANIRTYSMSTLKYLMTSSRVVIPDAARLDSPLQRDGIL